VSALPVLDEQAEFDIRWQLYERAKAEYRAEHPEATEDEYETFCKQLAERLGV
jgi:t-SNARE complex subunit (syntaxin)